MKKKNRRDAALRHVADVIREYEPLTLIEWQNLQDVLGPRDEADKPEKKGPEKKERVASGYDGSSDPILERMYAATLASRDSF